MNRAALNHTNMIQTYLKEIEALRTQKDEMLKEQMHNLQMQAQREGDDKAAGWKAGAHDQLQLYNSSLQREKERLEREGAEAAGKEAEQMAKDQ